MAKIIRMKQLTEKVGLCKSALYAKIQKGEFPKPFSVGEGRARGWLESTVDQWIQKQSSQGEAGV
ncbi:MULTISPECIES: helix-turn-helix transcriptional regulator [Burkholderia cepacia complex]|uniref:helix-turn-helix transcriptional regulator n=1 Tax=Burkholderia cepacia complex TaxID=87882 RepID=UPI0007555C28|nr:MULTISPECIES: AlpA family phage regulatory protein [Burkholderia cepacia complex]KWD84412.1 hypothetical protein WL69_12705 [Burkholderia cepacia]MBR8188780.1 AlpA family phage regulatory protein [Burkholderia vietnamiensis]